MADRTLLDALLEDAAEHEAAGRLIQAANARAAAENLRQLPPSSWTCPHCGRTSFNPNDLAAHYCGACHHFCDEVEPGHWSQPAGY